MNKKVAFYTLGCKLNFSETSTLARVFQDNGFEKVDSSEVADVYVINTCSVTEQADKKCRQAIRKFHRQAPDAIVAVTGCYAQLKPEEIAELEGVDLVIGADAKGQLYEYVNALRNKKDNNKIHSCSINDVDSFFTAFSSGDRTRSFMKVQDGCNYKCTYCTIPLARGKSRNASIAILVDEAKKIALTGAKEIILTGVNIGDFGRSTGENFFDLIKELDKVEGIERYRISSIEPNLLTQEIIEFTAQSKKFVPHYHIPLQSGSNNILKLMKRRYMRELFEEKIEAVRKLMPDTFFGIDVIVGFPGETDEEFMETYNFLERVKPSFLHIFPYSERPNTVSISMEGKVKDADSKARVKKLGELSDQLHTEFYKSMLGETRNVLFESTRKGGMIFGYTDNYIKVEIPFDKDLIGEIKNVRLVDIATSGNVKGSLVMPEIVGLI